MKRVIVTGATGFIGKCLCVALMEKGTEVYGIGRDEEKFKSLLTFELFHPVYLDFKEYDSMDEKIEIRGFDVLFHFAYCGVNGLNKSDYRIQLENTRVACDLVEMAKKLDCRRFVYSGSVDEFETFFLPDAKFKMPSHARIYGIAKFAAENIGKTIASDLNIEYVGVLLALTYGVGNKTNILPNMIIKKSMIKEPMNLINGHNYFDMIYIDEAIGGIIAVAENGLNMESYYIGHERLTTFKEYVDSICKILNTNIELHFGEYKDPDYIMDYASIDRKKLFLDTGYVCNGDLAEGIKKTKDWLIQCGFI